MLAQSIFQTAREGQLEFNISIVEYIQIPFLKNQILRMQLKNSRKESFFGSVYFLSQNISKKDKFNSICIPFHQNFYKHQNYRPVFRLKTKHNSKFKKSYKNLKKKISKYARNILQNIKNM